MTLQDFLLKLPSKDNFEHLLGNTKATALRRLVNVEWKLDRHSGLKTQRKNSTFGAIEETIIIEENFHGFGEEWSSRMVED